MKKICIVTVHKSLNSGSFLQAYALSKVINTQENEVFLLETKLNDNIKECVRISLRKLLRIKINQFVFVWRSLFSFCFSQKIFNEINAKNAQKIECFIIGSDTVWNFADAGFNKYKKRFLCTGFDGTKRITYAVSAGNSTYGDFDEEIIVSGIKKIDAISVRDNHTKEIVDKISGKESVLVLDPTLLLSREEFAQMETNCGDEGYILVYMFDRLSQDFKKSLMALGEKTGKRIVSFGRYESFADKNVSNDPFKFLYYFNHADMVITNTFHGTIFSIINRKPFADFGGHKKKVTELLDMLDLSSQLCETPDDIEKILNQKIDYDKVEEKLSVMREQSKDYLFNALKG